MARTPDYVLSGPFEYEMGRYDRRTLNAGMFVRPLLFEYVPQHVVENPMWNYFRKDTHTFCYTRYGIVAIPNNLLRET